MDDIPYRSALEAFTAIHRALACSIELDLADCEFADAMKLAEMMSDIEAKIGVSDRDRDQSFIREPLI